MLQIITKIMIFFSRSPKTRAKFVKKLGVRIGENAIIYKNVKFGSEPFLVSIGNNVKITSNVDFITHDGGVHVIRNLMNMKNIDLFGMITVGDNVFIGTNSVILPNVNIGNNCIIGANSVVTKNIPDNSVVAGSPARVLSNIEDYHKKNQNRYLDSKNINSKLRKEFILSNLNRDSYS